MTEKSPHKTEHDIDLVDVANRITKKLSKSTNYLLNFISFTKHNLIAITSIFIIGIALGFIYDHFNKKYINTIIVLPNFETVDYLYDKIEVLNSNINQNKTDFLPSINIDSNKNINSISVEPILDIYQFIDENESYIEVFKIISENNDAKKIINDYATSKHYPSHKIIIKSSSKLTNNDLEKLMIFINESNYYNKMRIEIIKNLKDEIITNNISIAQINNILNSVGKKNNTTSTILIEENKQLNDLLINKKKLILENHKLSIDEKNLAYIVTPLNYSVNIIDKSGLNGKIKFILPIILVFSFYLIALIRRI